METIYENRTDDGYHVITVKYYSYAQQKDVFEVFLMNQMVHTVKSITVDTIDEAYLNHLKMYDEWCKVNGHG